MTSSHHQNRPFLGAYSNGIVHLGTGCPLTIPSTNMTNNINFLETWSVIAAQPLGAHGFIFLVGYPSSSISQYICFLEFGKRAPSWYVLAEYLTLNTCPDAKIKQLPDACQHHPSWATNPELKNPSSYSVPSCCHASCTSLLQEMPVSSTSAEERPTCWVEMLEILETTLLQSLGFSLWAAGEFCVNCPPAPFK